MNTQITFALLMVAMSIIGFFCASRLDNTHPLWVRLVVLYPSLAALCTLAAMLRDYYIAYTQDIVLAIGFFLLYALVASRFTANPWLDIRVAK